MIRVNASLAAFFSRCLFRRFAALGAAGTPRRRRLVGITATASTSNSAPSRARRPTWIAVEAGGALVFTNVSRTSKNTGRCIHVDEEVGELHHMLEATADRGQARFQVLEALGCLRAKIAGRAGENATGRHAELPRKIDGAARPGGFDHLGVAPRRRYGFRIGKAIAHKLPLVLRIRPSFWPILESHKTKNPSGHRFRRRS